MEPLSTKSVGCFLPCLLTMAKRDKESDSDSGSSSSGDEWGKKTKKKGKRVKSVKEEEEREEGEVDDDEDDDLDDDDDYEFNDGYDDNLMGDEEDQKRLAEMTETQREQELFNRSEKREVLRTRFEIERKLRLQKRKDKALKDKPAKNEFTEASLRSDERRRNIESKKKQNSALQGLKEQREKKKQKAQILRAADVYSSSSSSDDDDDGGRKGSSSSSSSSSDESGDGKRHRGRRSASDDEQADNYEFTLVDLNRIRVTRKQLEQWVHSPFFSSTMINSFVKMGIGMRQSQQIYRVCQVVDVVEGPKVYELEKTKTDKLLKCRHAKDERNFSLKFVSNGEFMENEFDEWKQRCTRDNVDFPTRSLVESKKRDIDNARNHGYSDNDIALILKEKEKFNKTPKNYAMKKTELMKMKEEAEQNNNHELVHQLQQELDQLEERAKELDKQRTHSIAAISYINERNRLKNIAEAEKAILETQDDSKAEDDDPFRRRKCAPQLVHKFQKTKNPDGTPIKLEAKQEQGTDVKKELNGSSVVDGKADPAVKVVVKQEKKAASPTRDDLFDAHNFDIQIDFEIGSSLSSVGNSSFASSSNNSSGPDVKPSTNRRSLNLDEYKRKRGLI